MGWFRAACPGDIHDSDRSDREVTGVTLEGNHRLPRDIDPAPPRVWSRTEAKGWLPVGGDLRQRGGKHCQWM